jgi:ubiquinone/menaquinone biosynthesis C-methylase UbiE
VIIDPEEHELSALVDRLPSVGACRVLEIGCGDGRLTRRYAPRVGSVIAIDPDPSLIRAFRRAGVDRNVDVRACAVDQLDLPEHSVDTAIFSWSL